MKFAVFDCDGTLVDGQAAVCDAMETAFREAGLPRPERAQVRRIVGLSLPQAVRALVPDAGAMRQSAAVDAYKAAFRATRESGQLEEPLFEGLRDLLAELHRDGWQLAVATGKSSRGLEACLAGHGIADLFCSLQTADRHPSKPDPAMLEAAMLEAGATPEETVMIGDTSFDMTMARAAGVRAIGVEWGYHTADELRAAGAVAVAGTVSELRELIDG
ncbi:HAD-IA family hydrolase [Tsuneonella rigui]|uniref:HAD-IA family hydrolase n=1 Tax=Tsuneonella rigui TaxID=1708790 RepID=UPI000F7EE39E|nr:HAD-IA family hydrolase [Tsuneonella rigui]